MSNRCEVPLLTLAAGLVACQVENRPTSDLPVQVEDSAGVRIVEYAGKPEMAAPFQFPARPRYRHGTKPGDYAFHGIIAGRLFPDGGAVVYDGLNIELVVLNRDGTTHDVLARQGDGPGDVNSVSAVFALGQDSVMVDHGNLGRVALFVDGAVTRTVDMRIAYGLAVRGIASSGHLLMSTAGFSTGFEEEWLPGYMARFDMDTGTLDTIASYDHMSRPPPEGLRWNPIGASGRVTVATGQFVYTRSDRPEITWRMPDGPVTRIVRWRAEPDPLIEELLAGFEAALRAGNERANPGAPDADIERMTASNMAAYRTVLGHPMPLFHTPIGDAEGRVWLVTFRPGGRRVDAPDYTVISGDGEWLGTVEAPPRLRILDVAGGLVLGVLRDEMDVQSVVVYELTGDSS